MEITTGAFCYACIDFVSASHTDALLSATITSGTVDVSNSWCSVPADARAVASVGSLIESPREGGGARCFASSDSVFASWSTKVDVATIALLFAAVASARSNSQRHRGESVGGDISIAVFGDDTSGRVTA